MLKETTNHTYATAKKTLRKTNERETTTEKKKHLRHIAKRQTMTRIS